MDISRLQHVHSLFKLDELNTDDFEMIHDDLNNLSLRDLPLISFWRSREFLYQWLQSQSEIDKPEINLHGGTLHRITVCCRGSYRRASACKQRYASQSLITLRVVGSAPNPASRYLLFLGHDLGDFWNYGRMDELETANYKPSVPWSFRGNSFERLSALNEQLPPVL